MPLDLTLLSLHRINGQELPSLPGLMAVTPPRKTARGRERESLIVSLLLTGNIPFTTAEYMQLASEAASAYYNTSGPLTTALRTSAETVNRSLLERNLANSGRGQYVVGALTLASLRDVQLTLLQCGPTHALVVSSGETRHYHDLSLSGKGLGLNPTITQYFSQVTLKPGDRLIFGSKIPPAWESALASDHGLPALESTRKRMLTLIEGDVNATLIQATAGTGNLTILRATEEKPASPPARPVPGEAKPRVPAPLPPTPSPQPAPETVDSKPELENLPAAIPSVPPPQPAPEQSAPTLQTPPPLLENAPAPTPPVSAHVVGRPPEGQPSAYAIPPQPAQDDEALVEQLAEAALERQFPPSIPRLKPVEVAPETAAPAEPVAPAPSVDAPIVSPQAKRQAARLAVTVIQAWRRVSEHVGAALKKFLPRLLPDTESAAAISSPSTTTMAFIAIAVPVVIATIGIVMYLSTGVNTQFDNYLAQAQAARAQAVKETDPVQQREAWTNVLLRLADAKKYNENGDSIALRKEAQANLDKLLGVTRLNYTAAFITPLEAAISRLAASETDLYMLDAQQGRVLRASLTSHGFEQDMMFNCAPGEHGGVTTGPMVDLLTMPRINTFNSAMLGVDAAGNLLYCSPGQVPQVLPLTTPSTNWGRVTAITMEGERLYVLDAPSRAVWIYDSKDGAFPDAPTFYFGTQIPDIQDAIDIQVNGDQLYLLHADGHVTHCRFSNDINAPTKCESPVSLTNPFPAYGATNAFQEAHFTQLVFNNLTEPVLLLLDADKRQVFRITLRNYELQSILGVSATSNLLPQGAFSAIAMGPNHSLYVAIGGQVYSTYEAP